MNYICFIVIVQMRASQHQSFINDEYKHLKEGFLLCVGASVEMMFFHITMEEFVWTFSCNARELTINLRTILPLVNKIVVNRLPTETMIYIDYSSLNECLIFISKY